MMYEDLYGNRLRFSYRDDICLRIEQAINGKRVKSNDRQLYPGLTWGGHRLSCLCGSPSALSPLTSDIFPPHIRQSVRPDSMLHL